MDDPSIADLLAAIKLVALLERTLVQHEQALIEIRQRFALIEHRLAAVEARAA